MLYGKAMCEMTKNELCVEFFHALCASFDSNLDDIEREHYKRKAEVIRQCVYEYGHFSDEILTLFEEYVKDLCK